MGRFKDLTGQTIGRWHVVCRGENHYTPKGRQKTTWICWCDCQKDLPDNEKNYKTILAQSLNDKTSLSCGCFNREVVSALLSKQNKYDLESQEYGIGYTSNLNQDGFNEFWFDKEDYDLIKDYCWYFDSKNYLKARDGQDKISLHKLVMGTIGAPSEIEVDHIKQKRYDNRKSQLRIATNSQNQFNKGLRKNNTSGFTGVIWNEKEQIWKSFIGIDYECIYLGRFNTKEEAIKARKEAEEKYFGEWSYDNSQAM